MTPKECWAEWVALKRHFTSDYDYHRYGGKVRLREATFDTHPDRYRFEKLSRLVYPRWRMLGCLVDDEKAWLGDVVGDKGERLAADRLGKSQALTYTVRDELSHQGCLGLSALEGHPPIVSAYLAGQVSIETISVLACVSGAVASWGGDPVIDMVARRCRKYHPFLTYDRQKLAKEVVDTLSETVV